MYNRTQQYIFKRVGGSSRHCLAGWIWLMALLSLPSISPYSYQQSRNLQQGGYSCQNERRCGQTLLADKRLKETGQ